MRKLYFVNPYRVWQRKLRNVGNSREYKDECTYLGPCSGTMCLYRMTSSNFYIITINN